MAKTILVMDMPEDCCNCMFCFELDEGTNALCVLENDAEGNMRKIEVDYCQEKPSWCPLKEMPEKREQHSFPKGYDEGWDNGWNACIDAICGKE